MGLFFGRGAVCRLEQTLNSEQITPQAAPGSSQPRPIRRLGWACAGQGLTYASSEVFVRRKTNSQETRHPM